VNGFFEELKRRKVYRVAVAYVIAAGGIIQLASAVFPAWELPNWTLRFTVVLLLLGFPVALILAWAFDVTPQGIRTTPKLESALPSHRRRNVLILSVAGIFISGAAGFFLLPRASAGKMEKSIAVLPFENLSDDKENAYFADGIQDDILTNLSKIGDLKVVSRTSVMGYRGRPSSVREIGKALGVAAILEGTVRRSGNKVRINVQLINAANDAHVWAQEYDRDLTDVFAIQTDLAQKIASELQAQLSPREKEQLTRKPTENGEAYLAYVQANDLHRKLDSPEKLRQAAQLYERALQLDPQFARAAANFSTLESWRYHTFDPTEARRESARRLAERALALQPDSPEAHFARAYFLYYGERDFNGALAEFAVAQRGLPNDAEVYLLIGAIQRRQGRWAESTANMEKAAGLNPKDSWTLQNLAFNYQMMRDFASANRTIDRALQINPKSPSLWEIKSKLAIEERGDLSVARESFEGLKRAIASGEVKMDESHGLPPKLVIGQIDFLLMERKYAEALAVRQQEENKAIDWKTQEPVHRLQLRLLEGVAHLNLGQTEEARAAFLEAKETGEAGVREAPQEHTRHSNLALVLACLGERDAAIAEGKRATELLPESVDAFEGPRTTTELARVYAILGEKEKAIELLDGLLSRPSGLTVHRLKVDPSMEPIRSSPEFQALLAKYEPGR